MKDKLQLGYNILEKIKLNGYGNEIIEDAQKQLLAEIFLKCGFKNVLQIYKEVVQEGRLTQ